MKRLSVDNAVDSLWMAAGAMCVIVLFVIVIAGRRQEYTHKCLGCGTEWISDKPVDDINTCPNCPISIEELDRIIEELEKQRKDGER